MPRPKGRPTDQRDNECCDHKHRKYHQRNSNGVRLSIGPAEIADQPGKETSHRQPGKEAADQNQRVIPGTNRGCIGFSNRLSFLNRSECLRQDAFHARKKASLVPVTMLMLPRWVLIWRCMSKTPY